MTKINYTFKYSKKTVALKLTSQQVQLLRFIGIFGFVTTAQLNLLWSAIVKYPTSLSPSILSKWCSYNGLCNLVPISAKRTNKKEKLLHTTITLTNQARKWLAEINVLPYSYDYSAINSHNEQAIETIVQSIYTATFGKSPLSSYLPYITDTDDHYFYCAKALRGAQLKGVIERASQNRVTGANHNGLNKGASQKVQIHISQLNTTATTDKLLQLISLSGTNRIINYMSCLSTKLQGLLTDGGNSELQQLLNCYTINTNDSSSTLSINILPSRGRLSTKLSTATTSSKTNNVTKYRPYVALMSPLITTLFQKILIINDLYPNLLYDLTSNTSSATKRDVYIASRPKREKNYRLKKIVKRKKKQDSYSHNLFNQQSSLIGILNSNNSDDKKNSHVKHESQYKKHLKKKTKHLAFAYYYPNQFIRVEAYTADNICLPMELNSIDQLNAEQQNLLIILAYCNILIDPWYQSIHSTADFDAKWHLPVQDKLKYPLQDAPAQRGIDLISNPSFDINNYDFRSFNQQFGYTFAESKSLPFVADEMISFTRNQRKHEIFLELDNRTESNQTQVQKL